MLISFIEVTKMDERINLSTLGKHFSDEDKARELLEKLCWKDGVICPHCDSERAYKLTPKEGSKTRKGLWKCASCRKQFTVTTGTIMHGSHIPISKWLLAMHLICSAKKGISAKQLGRQLGLDEDNYQTPWFMAHRIRYAMTQEPFFSKLNGIVEVDETYIGGKAKNMHRIERERRIQGRGAVDKAPVVTLVERGGRIKSHHMEHVTGKNLKEAMTECIESTAQIMTDESPSYFGVNEIFADHQAVNHHKGEYVRMTAHVNSAESFHALIKRGVMGSFHHVSKRHLHRYLAEFDFRWNHRKISDSDRTIEAVKNIGGKRLRYKDPANKK